MDLTDDLKKQMHADAEACAGTVERTVNHVPALLAHIDVLETRLAAAMAREKDWQEKLAQAQALERENEQLRQQVAQMLDHPDVRKARAAALRQVAAQHAREAERLDPTPAPTTEAKPE